jgi:ribonuclease HI
MKKQKYYVVWKGRRSGVFTSWEACSAQVKGYVGAEFKSFDSLAAAESAYRGAYNEVAGKTAGSLGQWKMALSKALIPSISVDAACSGVPGPLEWRGVETATGKQVFKLGPYANGTNNVGEFLAIVQGLVWLKERQLNWPLYSDSKNAMLWVKVKKCRTKLERTKRNAALFELIANAETWLNENQSLNKVMKWETEDWGENPADFGRK